MYRVKRGKCVSGACAFASDRIFVLQFREMVYPTEMHKIMILQMIGYGDRTRTQAEVFRLLQEKYPELPPISQGSVTFTIHGHVNRQSCHYCSRENPHWMRELHTQNPEKVNVWAGIIGDNIIGLFFIDGNMNGETYLALLQNDVVPTMANLYPAEGNPQLPGNAIWFQQDGTPAHYEVLLKGVFHRNPPCKVICHQGIKFYLNNGITYEFEI
ncbi:hypothetical protein NQ318_021068 [Aromia moschata]|uniref:Uncharacterized protein n=1 Tax=Aromia moschata TaxID=1265417 RepID=A0AAV8Y9Q0_9CUCU|nr:hypothetical protein NQ318_021068 [Aromia moschata]